MRLWISRTSEVPVRDQLVAQIVLAITSRSLGPGEKLPSTRALARRLGIHANTVSAAYRELARRGWLENRRGSGVYVRSFEDAAATADGEAVLDDRIVRFLAEARGLGFSLAAIRDRLAHWLSMTPPDHLLVVEDEPELARILRHELGKAVAFPVAATTTDALRNGGPPVGSLVVGLYGRAAAARDLLPAGHPRLWLESTRVPEALERHLAGRREAGLVALVSRWHEFVELAETVLVAAGVDADALVAVQPRGRGWSARVRAARWVVADTLVADELGDALGDRLLPFPIVAADSLERLRRLVAEIEEARPRPGD